MCSDERGAKVYGALVWDVETDDETKQTGLIITRDDPSAIMVDDFVLAQFICLLLDREKIRNVINAVTRRGVLILGRFGDGGLDLLQAVAAWLRRPENGSASTLAMKSPPLRLGGREAHIDNNLGAKSSI